MLLANEMVVLFAVMATGLALGSLEIRGLSLGSAGVLFTALAFGYWGFAVPKEIMEFGLLLFVFAVGLQAGPRFFRNLRSLGLSFIVIAAGCVLSGTTAALLVARELSLPPDLTVGLFCGGLTSTPALAAAIDVMNRQGFGQANLVSVGYGIAYPFSVLGVVLLTQFLPRLLNRTVASEEAKWEDESRSRNPFPVAKQFRVSNANCDGKSISELNPHRLGDVNISRVWREGEAFAATPATILRTGDVVRAVGTPRELDILKVVLGEETQVAMETNQDILSVDIDVTDPSFTLKTLASLRVWDTHNIIITRVRREGIEFVPKGMSLLLLGDQIRVVGDKPSVEAFAKNVGGATHRLDETTMLPFLIGLLAGVGLGAIPIGLLPGLPVRLGSAGGAFLVSLVMGHYGAAGRFRMYVPQAAKNLARELGLMLFLAGAGTSAGGRFFEVLTQQGIGLFLSGALVTVCGTAAVILLSHFVFRMNILSTMGLLGACMTNSPSLCAAQNQTRTELPTLSYAGTYPIALIMKVIVAQLIVQLFAG